jgi:hypothetical protein
VISGIASLLPKGNGEGSKNVETGEKKTNRELNDEKHVKVVQDGVTADDWTVSKEKLDGKFLI